MHDLESIVDLVRKYPGLTEKRELSLVAATVGGDGADAAVVASGDQRLVLAAEAIRPGLLEREPRVAGIAGLVACLNDLAATGAEPLAVLDTVVGRPEAVSDALGGLAAAARLYEVPVVGGHTTTVSGPQAAYSVFALGIARGPVAIARARAGDELALAACTDGELVVDGDGGAFFSHLRGARRDRAAADIRILADAAAAGELRAARDVSMPGIAGSLVQMLDGTGLGGSLDLDRLPVPKDVPMDRWLRSFLSYGFLLVGDLAALGERFDAAGLEFARVGRLDDTGVVALTSGGRRRALWNLAADPLTGFSP